MVEEVTDGVTTSYLYGNNIDEALQMKKGGDTYYYHTNHLGSTMAITKPDGEIVERVEYDVFGGHYIVDSKNVIQLVSIIGNSLLYSSHEYNSEADLYYYRNRSLQPTIGRFLEKDPLIYVDGLNDYVYVMNNPVNWIDILGLDAVDNKGLNGDMFQRRGCPVEPSNTNNPFKDYAAKMAGKNAGGKIGPGLGGAAGLLGFGLGAYGGYKSAENGDGFIPGLIGAAAAGAATGAAIGGAAGAIGGGISGAAAGAAAGGVGAVPGAIAGAAAGAAAGAKAGAITGAISSAASYAAGYAGYKIGNALR